MMDHQNIIDRLMHNQPIIENIVINVPAEEARWKPSDTEWSLLEIICHMVDEEKDDFRTRLKLALENPEAVFPPIDPEGWAIARNYNDKDWHKTIAEFFEERKQSVSWLQNLVSANWKSAGMHPKMGPMFAEMILANWLAHDLIHIRQMITVTWAHLADAVKPVTLDYAGRL